MGKIMSGKGQVGFASQLGSGGTVFLENDVLHAWRRVAIA